MEKNIAGQIWIVKAWNETDHTVKTGDAANITANLRIDGGAANAVDDVNPTELEGGYYAFDITQAETNGDYILICPSSSTANIQVEGCPRTFTTTPPNYNKLGIESDGDLTKVNALHGHTVQTGDGFARLGAPAGASIAADLVVIDNFIDELETRLTSVRAGYLDNLSAGATAQDSGAFDSTSDDVSISRPTGAVIANAGNGAAGFATDLSQTDDDYWTSWVKFTTGALVNQVKKIESYNGTTKFLTFASAYTATPAVGDVFNIIVE